MIYTPSTGYETHIFMGIPLGALIYWSDEDKVFVADVPELPGCMAHGPTEELALSNVKDAMQLWIDTAKEFGDPIPEPKGRRLGW